jgi:hypothetical protein
MASPFGDERRPPPSGRQFILSIHRNDASSDNNISEDPVFAKLSQPRFGSGLNLSTRQFEDSAGKHAGGARFFIDRMLP